MGRPNEALTEKGGRHYTRGWREAKYVKAATSRAGRRATKKALKEGDVEKIPNPKKRHGWTW